MRRGALWLATLGWFAIVGSAAGAAEVTLRVTAVSDGDSIVAKALADGSTWKVRLWGVDAPETGNGFGRPGQPFATAARRALARLVLDREVVCTVVRTDQNGRTVARVTVAGVDVGLELLRAGLAWHDPRFAPRATDYAAAEVTAREGRVGLWHGRKPEAPWEWRARRRRPAIKAVVAPAN